MIHDHTVIFSHFHRLDLSSVKEFMSDEANSKLYERKLYPTHPISIERSICRNSSRGGFVRTAPHRIVAAPSQLTDDRVIG